MRILVVQESDWLERGPHQSHHLFERLRQRGHGIRVVDFEIGWRERRERSVLNPRTEFIAPPKVIERSEIEIVRPAVIHFPALDYASLVATHAWEVRKQLREYQPDVVVGLGLLDAFTAIRLTRRAGVPFIYFLIDELHRLVPEPIFRGLGRVIEQANLKGANMVLSINRALQEYAIGMGARPASTKVLPAGVDLRQYASTEDDSIVRRRYGLESGDLVLFFMGWVYPFSGLREVASSIVAGEGREARIRLIVVGKGDSWSELMNIAKKDPTGDKIKLVGFRPYPEMPSYLAAADVCLLPAQKVETMQNIVPIKVYEYLAAGKPVIATKLPGLTREFGENHGVVYVDGPEQVVAKAVELARNGSLGWLGRAGRAFVAGSDWNSITDTFESDLAGLVEDRAA